MLFLIGVIIPVLLPGVPSPVSICRTQCYGPTLMTHQDPVKSASILSFITWGYYDSLIIYASRHEQLPIEILPPLEERDRADILKAQHYKVCTSVEMIGGSSSLSTQEIDPTLLKKKRHVIWSLLAIFSGSTKSSCA